MPMFGLLLHYLLRLIHTVEQVTCSCLYYVPASTTAGGFLGVFACFPRPSYDPAQLHNGEVFLEARRSGPRQGDSAQGSGGGPTMITVIVFTQPARSYGGPGRVTAILSMMSRINVEPSRSPPPADFRKKLYK